MKNLKRKMLVSAVLFSIILPLTPVTAFAEKITVKGSDTMVILAQRWAEKYMNMNNAVTIQVTGGGSGTGIAALINGTTDIANASREIKPKEVNQAKDETGKVPFHFQVALDALSVVVHKDNPVGELTMDQIGAIYVGAINNWSEVGGKNERIIRYCRESNSGTYVFFKEHVMKDKDYAADCQTMPGTSAVADAVSRDVNGIGYGGVAYFITRPDTKILAVKKDASSEGVHPVNNGRIDYNAVYSGTYPISRYLNCYTLGEPEGDLRKYMEWIMSPDGQKLSEEVGYIPLPN